MFHRSSSGSGIKSSFVSSFSLCEYTKILLCWSNRYTTITDWRDRQHITIGNQTMHTQASGQGREGLVSPRSQFQLGWNECPRFYFSLYSPVLPSISELTYSVRVCVVCTAAVSYLDAISVLFFSFFSFSKLPFVWIGLSHCVRICVTGGDWDAFPFLPVMSLFFSWKKVWQ